MTEEAEFKTIKDLYNSVAGPNSASYDAFRKKLLRLGNDNLRTKNRVSRELGISPSHSERKSRITSDFVAYDGEGWSDKYVLLANSRGEKIVNKEGLSTKECLEFLAQKYDRPYKRIFFSFGYDVNHIIKDFSEEQVRTLVGGKSVDYEGFRVSYISSKIFIVNGYRYYDVFSFFATSFINTVKLMLGPESVSKDLVEGKSNRGSFETWDLERIVKYNDEELDLMVQVMEKLRDALLMIGVKLTEWYGPGAIAKYWFRGWEVAPKESHTPGSLNALNNAYYGGRFEQLNLGKIKNIYEYDIHSAYPSVMVGMPNFTSWRKVQAGRFVADPYSVWYITFDLREGVLKAQNEMVFGPLPVRTKEGRICYPLVGKGWYWYDEVKVMLDFFHDAKVTYHEGYVAKTEGKPFWWIAELYNYRRKLKTDGNQAQYAIKVGLNSLYGKCAQRVGRNPFFSLAWAGYITASTRAKLARAGYEAGSEHIIGFATDALFTDKKLQLQLSDDLGDWEESSYQYGLFIQSGVYRLTDWYGSTTDRYRGSPLRRGIDDIITQLRSKPKQYPKVKMVRFISNLLALNAPEAYGKYRNKFVQVVYEIKIDAPYKRHYDGLAKVRIVGKMPVITHDYHPILTSRIYSDAKVFAGDNSHLLSEYYLRNEVHPHDIESQTAPMKDANTQRLLEEANMIGVEEGYEEVADVELLPVVEDEME